MINEILKFNKEFVENKGYVKYITNKFPDKKSRDCILYGHKINGIITDGPWA